MEKLNRRYLHYGVCNMSTSLCVKILNRFNAGQDPWLQGESGTQIH